MNWIEMTKEEAVANHRKLWNEIADMLERRERYPTSLKQIALRNIGEKNDIYNECYCCEYTKGDCSKCPIVWNNNDRNRYMCENGEDSYYDENNSEWLNFLTVMNLKDYDLAAKIARDIANLPEKRGGD